MAEVQDLVVIGGGPGGFAAAMRAAQLGGKVTVVESTHYGGNCMSQACIPLTFLMTVAQFVDGTRRAGRFGIQVGHLQVDAEVLHERKDLIIEGLRMGTEQLLSDSGVQLIEGRGKLLAPDTVEANGVRIKTRNVVIATGSVPAQLPIEGADLPGVIGTGDAIECRDFPKRMAIVGSQPWDLELAQYFHAMGSAVTLIVSGDQILPQADRDVAQRLGKLLHDAGLDIKRRTAIEAIRQRADGSLVVVLAEGKGEVVADKVLATRRLANSTGLGLREIGVKMEGATVLVDGHMETSLPHVFAVGDVTVGPMQPHGMWSHKAGAEGIVAGENAMGLNSRMNYDILPHCAYTWPQVAWVGLTEEHAEAQGIEYKVGKVPVALNPHAIILDETAGEIKVITERKYGKILGAHLVAPGAVDLINTVTMAMVSEATIGELMRLIPRHPSIGEALVDAALEVDRRSLHMPKW